MVPRPLVDVVVLLPLPPLSLALFVGWLEVLAAAVAVVAAAAMFAVAEWAAVVVVMMGLGAVADAVAVVLAGAAARPVALPPPRAVPRVRPPRGRLTVPSALQPT